MRFIKQHTNVVSPITQFGAPTAPPPPPPKCCYVISRAQPKPICVCKLCHFIKLMNMRVIIMMINEKVVGPPVATKHRVLCHILYSHRYLSTAIARTSPFAITRNAYHANDPLKTWKLISGGFVWRQRKVSHWHFLAGECKQQAVRGTFGGPL